MESEGTSASNEKPMKSFIFFLLTYAFYLSDYLFCISKRTSSRTINSTFCVFQGIYSKSLCDAALPPLRSFSPMRKLGITLHSSSITCMLE